MRIKRLFESKADEQKLIDFAGEELAQKFFKLKNRLEAPENDLYYWIKQGDPELLRDKLDDILSVKTRKEKDVEASEGAELIYDQDGWKVYHITTYEASVKYGKNTKWCISGSKVWDNGEKGEEYFNDYTSKGVKFYFYIKNNEEKYALAYNSKKIYQVFNAEDNDVTSSVFLPNVKGLPKFEYIDNWVYNGKRKAPKRVITVTVKNGVTSIGDNAFDDCTILRTVTIPNSVESIGFHAFAYCKSLTNITIPDGVTFIGQGAFAYCRSLESINIPDGVTYIGNDAFLSCKSLTNITIPDGVTNMKFSVFSFCTNLTDITIPDSVTSIGEWAFQGCENLKSIVIPNSVKSIANSAFEGCPNLTIHCPAGSYAEKYAKENNIPVKLTNTVTESINTDDNSITETTTQIEKSDEGIKSLINDALKYCWGLYNSLTTLRINADAYGYKDIGENVKELEDSQYTNIGTLEGLLQTLDPNAETINDSSEEVVDEIEGAENG